MHPDYLRRLHLRFHLSTPLIVELGGALLCFAGLIFWMRGLLFAPQTTFSHDNVYWNFPVFHYFAKNLMSGHFPLWNPFSHGGEPFYPLLLQIRLLEPFTVLFIALGKYFSRDTVTLFHWHRLLLSLLHLSGIYALFRSRTSFLWLRISLMAVLMFSSLMWGSFQQDGLLNLFLWTPWITWLVLRIIHRQKVERRWYLLTGALIGSSFQSYFFAGVSIWLLLLLTGLLLFHRSELKSWWNAPGSRRNLGATFAIVLLMMAPNLCLLKIQNRFVFPLRMASSDHLAKESNGAPVPYEGHPGDVNHGSRMPYSFIVYTGGRSQFWDYLQTLAPEGNVNLQPRAGKNWGEPSDIFIYLGILPWLLAFWGLFFGTAPDKKLWILCLAGTGLLSLGPVAGLHPLLYPLFPPLWFVRNTGLLAPLVQFALMYFFMLGGNLCADLPSLMKFRIKPGLKFPLMSGLVLVLGTVLTFLFLARLPTGSYFLGGGLCLLFLGFLASSVGWVTRGTLFLALLFSQVLLILTFSPEKWFFCLHLFFLGMLPFYLLARPTRYRSSFYWFIPILIAVDLFRVIGDSPALFFSQVRPDTLLGIRLDTHWPKRPQPRIPAPVYPLKGFRSGPRYLELLSQTPTAFSLQYPAPSGDDSFGAIRHAKRWNSFLLEKNYFELVYSDLDDETLSADLGIGLPPLSLSGMGTLEVLQYRSNSLRLGLILKEPQKLIWQDAWDPDWRILLDGALPLKVERAGLMKQVSLPSGTHALTFLYEPFDFMGALLLFYLGAFIPFSVFTFTGLKNLLARFFRQLSFPLNRKRLAPTFLPSKNHS